MYIDPTQLFYKGQQVYHKFYGVGTVSDIKPNTSVEVFFGDKKRTFGKLSVLTPIVDTSQGECMNMNNYTNLKESFLNVELYISGTADDFHSLPEKVIYDFGLLTADDNVFYTLKTVTKDKVIYASCELHPNQNADYFWSPHKPGMRVMTCQEILDVYKQDGNIQPPNIDLILNG